MTAKIDGRLLEPSHTLKINGNTINYLKVNGKEFWRNVQPLRITKQPTDKAKKDKETLSLSCAVDAGRSTFVNYQWYRDGAKLGGQTSDTLERKLSLADDGAKWWCRITNDVGTVETRHASTTVKPLKKVIEINENVQNLNLYDEYTRRFPNAEDVEKVEFIIGEGVVVTGSTPNVPALETGIGWGEGVELSLTVLEDAIVTGRGGKGESLTINPQSGGFLPYKVDGSKGQNGGTGIKVSHPVRVTNNGVLSGGGGGGSSCYTFVPGAYLAIMLGGGGAPWGEAGTLTFNYQPSSSVKKRRPPTASLREGGIQLVEKRKVGSTWNIAKNGRGGNLGQKGTLATTSYTQTDTHGVVGEAGLAIQGVSNVTFINRGDIRGKTV